MAVDRAGQIVGKGEIERQVEQVFENLGAVLREAGGSFEHLVSTTTYLTEIAYRPAYNQVRSKYYLREAPTSTLIVVKSLANEDYLVEIDGIAVI